MSFFNELKRRNVFRVGIAYLVVSWLIMQVADVVINNIGAPGWVFQVIMLILGIGLPIALILAWAFELTADGLKKESEVDRSQSIRKNTGQKLNFATIGLLVVALGYFVWESRFASEKGSEPFSQESPVQISEAGDEKRALTPGGISQAATADKSVAVLPFVNMSSDPEQEYFSDGITEEIINALVKIPGLSVPARTSVFGFKGHQGDIREIGQKLNVAYILEGSIRSQANQVRITAQLIKVDDGYHLWSETFDRQLDNIFVVQEEIAAAISEVLVGALDVGTNTVPNKTFNMEAYDTYLHGKTLLRERNVQAAEVLEQATRLDPSFVPAWASLALAYQVRGYYVASGVEFQEKAKETARHALSMDPDNVDAMDALASALRDTHHWAEAEKLFNKALALDPQSTELLEDVAEFFCGVGRVDECLEVAQRGYAIDPNFQPLIRQYVEAITMTGHYEEAVDAYQRIWPDTRSELPIENGLTSQIGGGIQMAFLAGEDKTALTLMKEFKPGNNFLPVKLASLKLLAGTAVNKDLDALKSINPANYIASGWYSMSIEGYMLGYAEESEFLIDTLIDFYNRDRWGTLYPVWVPNWKSVRSNPRFQELLELYKLPEYWDETSWPDFCQRVDGGKISCE